MPDQQPKKKKNLRPSQFPQSTGRNETFHPNCVAKTHKEQNHDTPKKQKKTAGQKPSGLKKQNSKNEEKKVGRKK